MKFEFDVRLHWVDEAAVLSKLEELKMFLDELEAKVTAGTSVTASAITLLQELKGKLDAALALGDPATIIAKVQELADAIGAQDQALADAVAANTPSA